jgi:hypothetical protein
MPWYSPKPSIFIMVSRDLGYITPQEATVVFKDTAESARM